MNRLTGFETAIEYIENNITKKLDYENIAACAYTSAFHFQRIFSIYAGCTLGEYIRARRMTLAAAELLRKGSKVIDVAVKYGYETSESFSRAFSKFHGITPSDAKKDKAKLKAFSRLKNYESAVGGNVIEYSVVRKNNQVYAVFEVDDKSDYFFVCDRILNEWQPSTKIQISKLNDFELNDDLIISVLLEL